MIGSASSCAISRRWRPSRARGSFGAAARELGYTQSAVSQQIAQLERDRRAAALRPARRARGPSSRPTPASSCSATPTRSSRSSTPPGPTWPRSPRARPARCASGSSRASARASSPLSCAASATQWPRVDVRVREETDATDLLRLLEHGELDLDVRRPAAARRPVRVGRAAPGSVRPARLGPLRARRARRRAVAARGREAAADRPAQHRRARAVSSRGAFPT